MLILVDKIKVYTRVPSLEHGLVVVVVLLQVAVVAMMKPYYFQGG